MFLPVDSPVSMSEDWLVHNSSYSIDKSSTTSSCLAILLDCNCLAADAACPLVLGSELFDTLSDSLYFFAMAGGDGIGTGSLLPCAMPLVVPRV
ncbi:hypothetical protein VNO80_25278 [Phaseolus coccineus]|uniref:Uncharacterized protein n=1 Tax=Phaseolus coccineus TaxID=3886 RepID=A0AAN9LTZ4_PHACN